MSKKQRKIIAELERQQSILSTKVRVMQYYIGQLYVAKDSPTRDGAIYDKTKCVAYEQGEQVLNKSTFDWLKQTRPKQDKREQEKPAHTEPITPEKEQAILENLNSELAKFASLEVFNADRKNFFLPPVDKLQFDKMKAAIECTIAIAKMVRPDYFDKINQIKVPTSEQPKAEPKQSSDGADSPKKEPSFQSQLDQYHAELSDKVISEMNKTMEFWAGVLGLQASKQDETKQPEINHYDPAKATLNKMVLSHIEEMKLWLSLREHSTTEIAQAIQTLVDDLGLHLADFRRKVLDLGRVEPCKVEPKETVQCEEKQPETEQNSDGEIWGIYSRANKSWVLMVDSEHARFGSKIQAQNAIFNYIQNGLLSGKPKQYEAILIGELVKQIKEEQSKTDQPSPEKDSEKQGYIEPKKEKSAWIIRAGYGLSGEPLFVKKLYCNTAIHDGINMVYSPSNCKIETTTNKSEAAQYSSFELAKKQIDSIKHLGADKGCKFGRCELREIYAFDLLPETEQKEAEQSGEKLGETNQTEPEKQPFYLIQTNPNKAERLNAFYVERVNVKGIVQHTPNPNEAMNFIDTDAAQTEIDTIIANSAGRYDADDFKIVEKPTRAI